MCEIGRNFLWSGKITRREAVQDLLEFCLSFGPPKECRMDLMKKNKKNNGETREWKSSTVKFEETLFDGVVVGRVVKIPRDISYMTVLYRNCWMGLSEYMVRAWLDLVTKMQRYTLFAYSWSTSEECKKQDAVCISNRRSDINWMKQYRTVKAGLLIRGLKILRSSSEFYEIKNGGWPRKVLHVTKKKNYQKMGTK